MSPSRRTGNFFLRAVDLDGYVNLLKFWSADYSLGPSLVKICIQSMSPASGGFAPVTPPGLCPWTPLWGFRPPDPVLFPPLANFWLRSCMLTCCSKHSHPLHRYEGRYKGHVRTIPRPNRWVSSFCLKVFRDNDWCLNSGIAGYIKSMQIVKQRWKQVRRMFDSGCPALRHMVSIS